MKICHKSFQKKYTEIRERISEVLMTDILCGKFEAISNIGIAVRADQSIQGFCFCAYGLDCYRNQRRHGTDKEIGFKRGCIPLIVLLALRSSCDSSSSMETRRPVSAKYNLKTSGS